MMYMYNDKLLTLVTVFCSASNDEWLIELFITTEAVIQSNFGILMESFLNNIISTVQPRLSGPRLSGTSIIRTSSTAENALPRMRRRRGQ